MAVGVEQTLGGGEQGALPVGFDAAALKFEVEAIDVAPLEHGAQGGVDGIVERGLEFSTPPVEAEVEQLGAVVGDDGEEGVVACPGVVGGAGVVGDVLCGTLRQFLVDEGAHGGHIGCDDEQRFADGYFVGQAQVALCDLGQHVGPVGAGVRPGELDTALGEPLRRQRAVQKE